MLIPKICQINVSEQQKVTMIMIKFFIGEHEAVSSPFGEIIWNISPITDNFYHLLEIIGNWIKIQEFSTKMFNAKHVKATFKDN